MPSIPKPELELGNYICYADKPGVVIGEGEGAYIAYADKPGVVIGDGEGAYIAYANKPGTIAD